MPPKRKAKMGGLKNERPPKRTSRRTQPKKPVAGSTQDEQEEEMSTAVSTRAIKQEVSLQRAPSRTSSKEPSSDIDMPDASQQSTSGRSNSNDDEFETAPENQSGVQSQDVPSEDDSQQEAVTPREEDDEEDQDDDEDNSESQAEGKNEKVDGGRPEGWEPWMGMSYTEYRAQVAAYNAIQSQQIAREVNAVERATAKAAAPKTRPAAATSGQSAQTQQSSRVGSAQSKKKAVPTQQPQRGISDRPASAPQTIPTSFREDLIYDPAFGQSTRSSAAWPSMPTPNLPQGGSSRNLADRSLSSRFASFFGETAEFEEAFEAYRASSSLLSNQDRPTALNLPIGRAPPSGTSNTTKPSNITTTTKTTTSSSSSLTDLLRAPIVPSPVGLTPTTNTPQPPLRTSSLLRRHRTIPSTENMTPEMAAQHDPTMHFNERGNMYDCSVPLAYSMKNPNIIPTTTTDPFFNRFPGAGMMNGKGDTREKQRDVQYNLPRDWWQQFGGHRFIGMHYGEFDDDDEDDDDE